MAGDTWYKTNKTQPNRNQPWYHVLVHDSGGLSTYVAHSNVKQDTSGQAIDHPRIGCYFTKLEDGCYCLKENISQPTAYKRKMSVEYYVMILYCINTFV